MEVLPGLVDVVLEELALRAEVARVVVWAAVVLRS